MYQPPNQPSNSDFTGQWSNQQEQPSYPQPGYLQQPPSTYQQQPQTPLPCYQQPPFQQQPQYQQGSFTPPPMQPAPKPKKSRTWLWIVGMILVAIISYSVGAGSHSGSDTTATTSNNTSTSAAQPTQAPKATTKPANSHHKIGETITSDDIWQVTITSASTNQGTNMFQPKAGNVFLQIQITMKNVSQQAQTASSLAMWDLKAVDGTKYNTSLTDATSPDGQVEAGGPLKGTLTYEVPSGTKTFTLSFITSLADPSLDVWDIQVQ